MNNSNFQARAAMLAAFGLLASGVISQPAVAAEPYKVLEIVQTNGTGGIDYVSADNVGRRLYIPRGNQIMTFDLDSTKCLGAIPDSGGHGVAVDPKSHHGFSSSPQITMFDTTTMQVIKHIQVEGGPDGIMFEPFTGQVYILSHRTPNVTAIDPAEGTISGTIDLGGAPEQGQSDGAGTVYIDLEDQNQIAVVDAKTRTVKAHYNIGDKAEGPSGLGLDAKNNILFAFCRNPASCVILSATDGKIITTLPIGAGTDGGGFNPNTMEAFSSQRDGTLTIIKENSPTSFEVEQTVQTKSGGKCCTLDTKNNHIIVTAIERAPAPAGATPGGQPAGGEQAGGRRGRGGRGGGPGLLDVIVVGRP